MLGSWEHGTCIVNSYIIWKVRQTRYTRIGRLGRLVQIISESRGENPRTNHEVRLLAHAQSVRGNSCVQALPNRDAGRIGSKSRTGQQWA